MLESIDAKSLFLLVSHDRDVDPCTAQVTTHLHEGHRGVLDPWIMQVHHDGITHYLANGLGNFKEASGHHAMSLVSSGMLARNAYCLVSNRPVNRGCTLLERASYFLDGVCFQNIIDLDVVESRELDTAFHTALDFPGIVFFPSQRIEWVITNRSAIAVNTNPATSLNRSAGNLASGDIPQSADGETSLDHSMAEFHDPFLRFQLALEE